MGINVYVIMGVAGSGKTTTGKALAKTLNVPFYDADDFHSAENKRKMASGEALTDTDRGPWLEQLAKHIADWQAAGGAVLACSALKQKYRDHLSTYCKKVRYIYLEASKPLATKRLNARKAHYMPASLVNSQFDALEVPKNSLTIDAALPVDAAVKQIMQHLKISDIGLIGLGVMGKALARNLDDKGLNITVYNPPLPGEETVTRRFIQEYPGFTGADNIKDFCNSLQHPAVILLMVKAGEAVDNIIDQLAPHLQSGDIIIDGGNSLYTDTNRRVNSLDKKGIYFVGMGVSGGESGALNGPAMIPGGNPKAKDVILNLFTPAAAKTDDGQPCIHWVGDGGAGHFVKMIHNGLEYADMQLIAEVYDVLRTCCRADNATIADAFAAWNDSELASYLIQITAEILQHKENDAYTLDAILDTAGQKGTGKWTINAALDLGVAVPSLSEAVNARLLSANKAKRLEMHDTYKKTPSSPIKVTSEVKNTLKEALLVAKILSYAQGLDMLKEASLHYNWELSLPGIINGWKAGCIIRAHILAPMSEAADNLLLTPYFSSILHKHLASLKEVISLGMEHHVPLPVMSASIHYFNGLSSDNLPVNLIQAQRDYFGAHGYERKDAPGKPTHTNWNKS